MLTHILACIMREIIGVFFIGLVYGAKVDGSSIIKSCCDIAVKNVSYFSTYNSYSGVYNIIDFCSQGPIIQGYCDAFTDGGGWLVIQRRNLHGNENFDRPWLDYERGFGSLHSEFWYGLRSLHCITIKGIWELRVDFTFTNWTNSYLHYNNFRVGPATDNYRLNISGFLFLDHMDECSVHMIKIMIDGVVIVHSMHMVIKHQVDGGTIHAIVSTSITTIWENLDLYF